MQVRGYAVRGARPQLHHMFLYSDQDLLQETGKTSRWADFLTGSSLFLHSDQDLLQEIGKTSR